MDTEGEMIIIITTSRMIIMEAEIMTTIREDRDTKTMILTGETRKHLVPLLSRNKS